MSMDWKVRPVQQYDIFQRRKQNMIYRPITGTEYSTLHCHKM